ncbi:nuclear autoantigen Sp-100 isoform X5 [Dasypus novemcinctus]|uniref:nuclear autoantigen Sp-100 isoform X5 n=1 Tax=Dasypus novemcinctus TaxID=9361 RepID=UPI0039C94FCF
MAGGSDDLNPRMLVEDQHIDEQLLYEVVFNHFREYKVEISSAIKKTFPFLYLLRDRKFITDKMVEDSEESCRNLIPVERVVYNVLDKLEKTFDLTLLEVLFSDVIMKNYPDLLHVYKNFEKEVHYKLYLRHSDKQRKEEWLSSQPSLEQGTGEDSYPSLSWLYTDPSFDLGTTSPENGISECLYETDQKNAEGKVSTSDESDALGSQEANYNYTQESEPTGTSNLDFLESNEGEAALEATCSQPQIAPGPIDLRKTPASRKSSCRRGIALYDDSELSNGEEPQEAFNSPPHQSGTELLGPGVEKCPCIMCAPEYVSGAQEAEGGSCQAFDKMDTMDIGNNFALGKRRKKRKRKRIYSVHLRKVQKRGAPQSAAQSASAAKSASAVECRLARQHRGKLTQQERKRIYSAHLRKVRKRVPRFLRAENMNFHSSELPVACGKLKGILYKQIIKQGVLDKSIQSEDGKWFTPREFEIEGGYGRSKNWKISIRCGGWPLQALLKKGYLPDPPRRRKKKILTSDNNIINDPYAHSQLEYVTESDEQRLSGASPKPDRWSCIGCFHLKASFPFAWMETFPLPHFLSTPENANECEVCKDAGQLYCCDTCSRSFHKDCHIPSVETEREPWSCIFCRIKDTQERCPEFPLCQESEVLQRPMLPEEKLKCEFLLLKICCCSESLFFANRPNYNTKKPVSLNLIRKRLNKNLYLRVEKFVQDMRLIFHNHRIFYQQGVTICLSSSQRNVHKSDISYTPFADWKPWMRMAKTPESLNDSVAEPSNTPCLHLHQHVTPLTFLDKLEIKFYCV